ncbi:MAG: long-chain fatty acid--CoA ligase [Alphaproteobacteria bacterium]|nr:MAG: long-chain fatty acid--CoA ligase [Alphaproteobacteria bacterium]
MLLRSMRVLPPPSKCGACGAACGRSCSAYPAALRTCRIDGTMADARPDWHRHYDKPGFDPERMLAPSLGALMAEACAEYGSQAAFSIVLPNGWSASLDFATVDRLSDDCAWYLRRELGLAPGDVVAIQAPNILSYPIAAYGVFKAGLTLTGLNPLFTPAEARYQLADSGARALFVIDLAGDRLAETLEGTAVEHIVRLSVGDLFPAWRRALISASLRRQGRLGRFTVPSLSLAQALRRGRRHNRGPAADHLARDRALDDVAMIQYTSGTTGRPKGAEISERNLLVNMTQGEHFTGDTMRRLRGEGATSLLILPLYHIYALIIGTMHATRYGTHVVLIPNPRPLSNLRPAFERFEITVLPGINTLFAELLRQDWFVANPPRSLRLCFSGAAPLAKETRERWQELTGCPIYEGYGLTEGTCVITSSPLHAEAKPGSVGVPIPGTEIRIVDEGGHDLPPGEPGEVIVRGPQVMRGYRGRAAETAETVRDGWLHTGDIGFLDEDGFLTIVDRKKDMLLVSGFNVYPAEIEAVLAAHPGVAEVAVVGAPDDRSGEVPWAYVVRTDPTLDADTLAQHAAAELTNYKRPRRYVFLDALPKSPVGKILRRELRDMARAEVKSDPAVPQANQ